MSTVVKTNNPQYVALKWQYLWNIDKLKFWKKLQQYNYTSLEEHNAIRFSIVIFIGFSIVG